jgi:hypothetical protein
MAFYKAGVGLNIVNSDHITVLNPDASWNAGEGIYPATGASDVLISGGVVHDNGTIATYDNNQIGIGGSGTLSNITITGVSIYGSGALSPNIEVAGGAGISLTNVVISQNIFSGTNPGGVRIDGKGNSITIKNNSFNGIQGIAILETDAAGGSGVTTLGIYNNTIYSSLSDGIKLQGATSIIKNNILANNATTGAGYEMNVESTATFTSDYNDIYHAAGGNYMNWHGTAVSWATWKTDTTGEANSKTTNPLFTNAGAGDFTLAETSPARSAGTPITGYTFPYGAPDLGAISAYQPQANTLAF